ncbi:MAG: tandem-95 repeat protein [Pirellulaceae bacterium]|nr:tandem-95 repeat protein [Pirellulaceae bacterium]
MAIRSSRDKSRLTESQPADPAAKAAASKRGRKEKAQKAFRQTLVETLEPRHLMAAGPQLIGIQPNNSDLIENGVVRDIAPRELTFRFDDAQVIDAATAGGIRLTRSGSDGSFGLASASSDFGTAGRVDIQFTLRNPGQALTVITTSTDRGAQQGPLLNISGNTLSITLNSNATSPTTASQLINAINSTVGITDRVSAKINGGFADTKLTERPPGAVIPPVFPTLVVSSSNDSVIVPGSILIGSAPNENEVTFRFAEALKDDFYRIEVFGFDDAANGIVGLRNVASAGMPSQLFQPTVTGTRQDTIDFRLDLGSQVTGVVPQPVIRNANGSISQLRNTIVVYFDSDKLLVENDLLGNPTLRSAEHPDFYQLIYTADTVRNTDDTTYNPTTVRYNASNNSATLTFSQDIDNLRPLTSSPRSAYRLRIGTRESTPFSPVPKTVAELGDTFTTADNLGVIGSATTPLTSVILTSEIKTTVLGLDRLGASDDPGHRDLGATGFENHINENFGADKNPGITNIFYNFRSDYASGFTNSIRDAQKDRVREALQIWSNYLGVQFTESANSGLTFSTGVLNALFGPNPPNVSVQNEAAFNYRVRIDPALNSAFNSGLLVMDANRTWNNNYGEDYFRIAMTAIGMMLGLEHAGDLPDSTLLSMNPNFLNAAPNSTAAGVVNFEPIFPGSQDILHGQFVHRPDNSDIDLYRFEIDFGADGTGRVGEFVAETFAERSKAVSSLDTNLRLYKQKQATAVSNFNASDDLAIQFTAVAPGQLGNHVQIVVTQSPLGVGGLPGITVSPNFISVNLNSTTGSETTAGQLIAAIQANVQASALVQVSKLRGADSSKIGAREIVYSPIELVGGQLELIAQNDDYFSEDSLLRLKLGSGVYFVGVSASGNNSYDPTIPNSGTGGRSEGTYDLRMTFRAQTSANDSIQDTTGQSPGDVGRSLDGDGDGKVGGVYDFWFETRALNRVLEVNNSGSLLDGQVITITGNTGVVRRFELSTDAIVTPGNLLVQYKLTDSPIEVAKLLADAINGQGALLVSATPSGSRITLTGDRIVTFSPGAAGISAEGKTIFVDKLAGPNADGSLARPFNNIQGAGVPNAFGSTLPGDIVRIVGNGGADGNLATVADNIAYEFGFGLLPNSVLTDGVALEVPKGVIAMVDAGAVFKSRRSYFAVGSSNTGIDRSGSNLQVLGTPQQPVYFTSWLDETIGRDNYGPTTTPSVGDWGGIIYQRNVDRSQGRQDKEDQGIFLNYVNQADIRYGGGGGIVIESTQQVVNPIQVIDGRPTISFNTITLSADAALSATPNSFEETLFTDLRFQSNGSFTPDYDRVGPNIHGNRLFNNSLNGLFIKLQTLPGEALRTVTLAARFDDIDVTHILAENLLIQGTPGGSILDISKPDTNFVGLAPLIGGALPAGTYNYRATFVDQFGVESVSSNASNNLVTTTVGSINVTGLPNVANGYTFVRLYRSDATGAGTYTLVAQLDSTQNSFIDRGRDLGGLLTPPAVPAIAALRPRLDASLVVDPGSVVKLEGARIELGQGVQFIAEGTQDLPIVFTSKLDDRSGAGGTFDTNNDKTNASPSVPTAGNWGGIYVSSGADVSIDHTILAYGGGVTRLDGTFRSFNILELQQGTARVANSTFEFNANGVGGQGPTDRFGRLANEQAVVFVRGSSPIFINNVFQNNSTGATGLTRSSAITIDSNSLNNQFQGDRGRQSGMIDRITTLDFNRGPLFRGNSLDFNDLNGLKIRADNRARNTSANVLSIDELTSDGLTVESVWDDTDMVHILFDGIFVSNLAHASGLRLQSLPTESLIVKVSGAGSNFDALRGAGFTAGGIKSSIDDRVGGTIHAIGQPGFPVIITSLQDDTVGAGLRPDGKPQTDTNNDGIGSIPRPGDWRGILLDQNSNDRNVAFLLETEAPNAVAPGLNGSVNSAQVLGQLATNGNNTDENLRLGIVVKGILSQPEDIDVYSFTGVAGTEVWIDIDHTSYTLDTVVELLDANGTLLARSDNSTFETAGTSTILTTSGIQASRVNPLAKQTVGNVRLNASGTLKEDGTTNPRDAGFRIVLPGANNTRSGYFFRVRSASTNSSNFNAGLTAGSYEVQVRLREAQEFAGSNITGADIRYATNGIHLRGLPGHSPLLGEASEDESVRTGETFSSNDLPWSYNRNPYQSSFTFPSAATTAISTGNRPQYVGNVLKSDRAAISIAGNLSSSGDVDYYRFSLTEQDIVNNVSSVANLVFDVDYADGLNRADTNLSVYKLGGVPGEESWQLVYFGEGSNISDDQRAPLSGSTAPDFSSGSFGTNDPFINTQALTTGEYLVAVSASNVIPSEFSSAAIDVLFRDDSISEEGETLFIDLTSVMAAQNPRLKLNSFLIPNTYQVSINGVNTPLNATFGFGAPPFDLTPYLGTFLILTFPALGSTAPPATQRFIGNVLLTVDGVNSGAERTPFSRISTPQLNNLFTNPLNIPSLQEVVFDLSGYSQQDLPAAYFNYTLLSVDYNVTVESSLPTQVATYANGPLVTDGVARQAKVDLGAFAGLSNVKLVFTPTGLNPLAFVTRVIVGFAERGESVTTSAPRLQSDFAPGSASGFFPSGTPIQPLFVSNPLVSTTQQTGTYQLEIRKVEVPTIVNSNDRDARSFALIVPSVSLISDGATFQISDGANSVDFEFNSAGSVKSGSVSINFTAAPVADSVAIIAERIRDAINSSGIQSRLRVQAASGDGTQSGAQTGNRINLFGAAKVSGFFNTTDLNLLVFSGNGDQNINRDQGQTIVSGNTIRQSRDYGVWSEAGLADYDPRDLVDTYSGDFLNFPSTGLIDNGPVRNPNAIIQSRPRTVGSSPGPVRNLQELNDDLVGGFNTGVVVNNNIFENGGLGGVHVAGENPIWMVTPVLVPSSDHLRDNEVGTHFGSFVDDGDRFFFDSGRTRVGFEFEDIAGASVGAPNFGSGQVSGNGWDQTNVPVYYREDTGAAYLRGPATGWGYSALETVHALRDAVIGSILVTNGTTQNVTATVAMSLLAPSVLGFVEPTPAVIFTPSYFDALPFALVNNRGLNWANRPALYLEGVTNIYFRGARGGRPWDVRRVDRAESPQAFARIINNTIVGNDGRASFGPTPPAVTGTPAEQNDLIANSVQTSIGANATEIYTVSASIGDNPALADPTTDVDIYRFTLNAGERIRIDVDTDPQNNPVDTVLQIYLANGTLVNLAGNATPAVTSIDNQAAPGEAQGIDPYIDFTAPTTGIYYAAVSAQGNIGFDPRTLVGRLVGSSTGDYSLSISLSRPIEATASNDVLADAVQTRLGVGINPQSYSLDAVIGDNARLTNLASDVDLYQVKLDVGDRIRVNINTVFNPNPTKRAVDTVLQLFDSSGRPVNLAGRNATPAFQIERAAAPGEIIGVDPYLDYAALKPGLYYVAISASGNNTFDPQSTADRQPGVGTGLYSIDIEVLQPNEFTITVEAAPDGTPLYEDGDTFTVYQVADFQNTTSNSRVFEFTTDLNVAQGNVPVFIGPDYFIPDVARSIAKAINNADVDNNQQPDLNNLQQLDNGTFGTANPLAPVFAVALGGVDGVEPGLRLFPGRDDGFWASLTFTFNGVSTPDPVNSASNAAYGTGHDRRSLAGGTGSEVFGIGPTVAFGDGTSERFVVIRNASSIESHPITRNGQVVTNRRSIQVDPDRGANYNMNQLIPESGVLLSAGASPTVLNNVFYNVQTPIVREETRSLPPSLTDPLSQLPLVFGTTNIGAADRNSKPAEIIVGGNVYQFIETQTTFNRSGFGIQASPTNIPNTQADFNFVALNSDQLFVNPQAGQYLPAPGSRLIDSSIDSLTERDKFNTIKTAVGIAPSPILAPSRDAFGQLRVDDPNVAPPQGLGSNIFKDRGALDRADFTGPTVLLLRPIDNDSGKIDRDPSISYVQLSDGTYPEFRLQLSDTGDSADPFPGIGIDDDSVLGPNQAPTRLPGAVLTIREDGRTLREGIDYVFAYDPTTKVIILTPLAGVWRQGRVYEIKLNNRDRFVIQAPEGSRVNDGEQFQIKDTLGGVVSFEFDSGYRLQLPTSLRLILPIAGGGAGGVSDGDRFTIGIPIPGSTLPVSRTFELDRNGNTLPTSAPIAFLSTDSQQQLAAKIVMAIANDPILQAVPPQVRLTPRQLADGSIFLGAPSGATLAATGAALSVPLTTVGFRVPSQGPLPGGVTDGQTFTVSDGNRTLVFEIDTDNAITLGNIRIDTSASSTASDVADRILQTIVASGLNISPTKVGTDSILLGLSSSGSASVGTSQLLLVGVSKNITDGQSLTITYQPLNSPVVTRTFEFDNDGIVGLGNTSITISTSQTEEDLGTLLAQAINDAGLSLSPQHLRNGNIAVGGTPLHSILISPGTEIGLFGTPQVTPSTSLELLGSLVMVAPSFGGLAVSDGSSFTITNNNQTVTFEFDNNLLSIPTNVRIPFTSASSQAEIASQVAAAIQASTLGLTTTLLSNGRVDLGFLPALQLLIQPQTGLTTQRGSVSDGETFTVSNGATTVTFEFDNTTLNNGRGNANVPILYTISSTLAEIATSMRVAIASAGLGVAVTQTLTKLDLDDTPRFTYNIVNSPSIRLSGLPGGAIAIPFIQDSIFTGEQMQAAIVRAINSIRAGHTNLNAIVRIGDSLFVENAVTISSNITNYFLRGVKDLADNNLRANRINNETQFTILMPGATLDFGDAPDPFTTTSGRYPTLFSSNGARHVLGGQSEVQVVGWTAGDPVVGTFTLSHGSVTLPVANRTTPPLPTTATAAQVQAALELLPTIGVGNVLVELLEQPSGSPNVSYQITFRGLLNLLDVPQTTIALTSEGVIATPVSSFEQTTLEGQSALRLGKHVTADSDGRPTSNATGDAGDDGVTFSQTIVPQSGLPIPAFIRNVTTTVTVTASAPGLLDAWVDFNADGDWDDPNEQIVQSFEFIPGFLTQTFAIQIPANTPLPAAPTLAIARFRLSTEGGLLPTGLATNGEVEDYAVTIVPGAPPVVADDNYSMIEDSVGGLVVSSLNGVLVNDTDPDSPVRFVFDNDVSTPGIQPIVGPQNGSLTLNIDGSFTYVPNADYFGVDKFVYRAHDGILLSVFNATVTITVAERNDFPVVADRNKDLEKNQVYNVTPSELLSEGSAPPATPGPANESNQTLTITRVDSASANGGVVTFSAGRIIYTPVADFVGTDSFTFLVTDNGTTNGSPDPRTTTGTIVFTISDRNSAPIAGPDVLTVAEDMSISRPTSFFLSNDAPGGPSEITQTLALTSVDPSSTNGGTVTFIGDTITFTPAANFNGTDTFFYTITDNGQTNGLPDPRSTRGTVTVTVTSVNDAPQVISPLGSLTVQEDAADRTFDLKTVFTDVDVATNADVVSYSIAGNSRPTLISPTIGPNGILTIDFLSDQNGTANIIVRATDLAGAFVDSTLSITVNAVPDAPRIVANIPDQSVLEDATPIVLTISPNFIFDPDVVTNGDVLTITATSNNTSLVNTSVVGSVLTLTLVPNQSGQASITVTGRDASGQTISDTFLLDVAAVNDAPTVSPRSYSVPANGSLIANDVDGTLNSNPNDDGLLVGSTDVEGNSFNAVLVRQPTRGTVSLGLNGTFTYTPTAGGTVGQVDTFTFRAVDVLGAQSSETTVTINFGAFNASVHQNPTLRFDVNADGFVSPIDALIVINYLNRNGSGIPVSTLNYSPAPYRDVNGDFFLSPIDVLQIINELNRRSRGSGGEGEAAGVYSIPIIISANSAESQHFWRDNVLATQQNQLLPMQTIATKSMAAARSDQAILSYRSDDIVDDAMTNFTTRNQIDRSTVDAVFSNVLQPFNKSVY